MSSALIRELLFSFSNVLVTELCRDTEFCLDLTRGPKILVLPYTEELKLQTIVIKQKKLSSTIFLLIVKNILLKLFLSYH